MLPFSCYDNNVYNALLNWIKPYKDDRFGTKHLGVKFDNSNKVINVYTDNPGALIGPQGKTIDKVTEEIRKCKGYEDYEIKLFEICMFINADDEEISDEQHMKDWEEHINFRFNSDFEDDDLGWI